MFHKHIEALLQTGYHLSKTVQQKSEHYRLVKESLLRDL